jgi:biotin carboxylase
MPCILIGVRPTFSPSAWLCLPLVCLQVVEIAPAYGLDETVRERLHADAVKLAKHVGYVRLKTCH